METRQIIPLGVAASVVVHVSFLVLLFLFSHVHQFNETSSETVAVDLVTPEQADAKPPPDTSAFPQTQTLDTADMSLKAPGSSSSASPPSSPPASSSASQSSATPSATSPAEASPAAASPPAPASKPVPQQQAALPKPVPEPKQERQPLPPQPQTLLPLSPTPPLSAAPAATPVPTQTYTPAQPDISIKYHVLLGLPQDKPGGGFDAVASQAADVVSSAVADLRRHLKTCAKLPASVTPTDKLSIKLRVLMTPDGRLAAEPALIAASASAKGPALMQSAISALEACQPYDMLPADKYNEWKILDLDFTPQDFAGAS